MCTVQTLSFFNASSIKLVLLPIISLLPRGFVNQFGHEPINDALNCIMFFPKASSKSAFILLTIISLIYLLVSYLNPHCVPFLLFPSQAMLLLLLLLLLLSYPVLLPLTALSLDSSLF